MTERELIVDVIVNLLIAIIIAIAAKCWGALSTIDKRVRRDFLKEIESPEFFQKTQRRLFSYIGLVVYALGAYVAFTIVLPLKFLIVWKFLIGITVLVSGGMIMMNAAVMNEYGVSKRKEAIQTQMRKEAERKQLKES